MDKVRLLKGFVVFWVICLILFCFCRSQKKDSTQMEDMADHTFISQEDQSISSGEIPNQIDSTAIKEMFNAQYTAPAAGKLSIQSFGPKGQTEGQVQIKISFSKPIVPLATLSDKIRDKILGYFTLDPQIKGKFRIVGTQAVVFEPEHSLPMSTEYQVSVKKGLRDIEHNELKEDFSWEFRTPYPRIRIYPDKRTDHVDIEKEVQVVSSVALDLNSLKEKTKFYQFTNNDPVEYDLLESDKNPRDGEDIGTYRVYYTYFLDPIKDLEKNRKYAVKIEPGLMTKYGNLPTEHEESTWFVTYPPFRFVSVNFCPDCGNKLTTQPYLLFTNNPQWDDFIKLVKIEPMTERTPFQRYGRCKQYSIGLSDFHLEPNTTYTVTLNEHMTDIYGQPLENAQSIVFTTGEFTPKMWGRQGYQIITPHLEPKMAIKTVNINTVYHRFISLEPKDILVRERLDNQYYINKLMQKIKSPSETTHIELDSDLVGRTYFDLAPYFRNNKYGVVAYSFASPDIACHRVPIEINGCMLRTNIGIFAQFHPNGGVIKLNQLTDGSPVSSAQVSIYREDDLPRLDKIWDIITNTKINNITPCYQGQADDQGMIVLSNKEMRQCATRRISNKILNELYPPEADPDDILYDQERFGMANPPRLLIVVENGDDWTFLQTDQWGNPAIWDFGLQQAWEAERPISKGVIFSDQNLYRPGDTVKMKGISRYLLFGHMVDGRGLEYDIKIHDPQGAVKQLTKVKVSDFGTFHFDVPTKKDQSLGTYTIIAESANKTLKFYGHFRLAEFRVPEFQVTMGIDKKFVYPKEKQSLDWEGKYYFGAPMSEASSSLNITRRPTYFRPKGWSDFTFGVPKYLNEKDMSLSGLYLRETIPLDKTGGGSKNIELINDDIPYPMTYQCDVEVTDVSNQTMSANKSFVALPYDQFVGLNLSDWIIGKNDAITASLIVTSAEGKIIPNIPVRVKLIRREYYSVKTKRPDGRFRIEHATQNIEVESKTVKSGQKPVTSVFIPKKSGSFYILAELANKPESGTAAARSIWVAGEDYVPWKEEGEDKLEVILDKKEYKVGDEAVVFVRSPFPEAELFVNVCREKIFLSKTQKIKGSGYRYRFTVTEDMLPNAYVGVVLFRLGDAIVPVEEEKGKHMEKIGFAGFDVSVDHRKLDVTVLPDVKTIKPAETLNVNIQVNDNSGTGHRSELTVMVVDEAVLSLTGYRPPDLLNIVYSHRGLSARLSDNRPFVITKEELLQKGMGYGGGLMEMEAAARIRKEFLKLAYYNPGLITDQDGKTNFSVKLPDNLTTWRIMVVAVGEKDHFGYKDETVVVTQPFILRPILPRFTRLGDYFKAGVSVTNLTEGEGDIEVKAKLDGKSIILKDQQSIQKGIRISRGESKAVVFPFLADQVGETQLTFSANFKGSFGNRQIVESDALQIPLMVQDLVATETVVAVGETKDLAHQQIIVDNSVRQDMGGLDLTLSSTALTNIGEGAKYLVHYPYGCLEQTTSRLLTLLQLKFLSDKYGFSLEAVKPVEKVIQANLNKVFLMQNSDGGFKFWPTSNESTCYLSPYVAYLFKRCQQLDYEIPEEKIENLIGFLNRILRNPCYEPHSWRSRAEFRINVLMGLHYLDQHDETYFEEYYNRRNDLSYGAQIQLAYLLYQSKNWKDEARNLLSEIKNGMFITAQTAHFESPRDLPPSWLFMYSPVITTAEAVKLFLEIEPESELIGKMSRYILNARKNGQWRNTYENARAIDGLVEISLRRENVPPDYTAKVLVAGNELLKQPFSGYQYKPCQKLIPIVKLPKGLQDINISKKGKGFLYYILSYSYRLKGMQEARMEGFSIQRTVKSSETGSTIARYKDVPPSPIQLTAGDVIEIVLEYNVQQTGYHMVIDDPIPAGLEAIDASLKTTSARYQTGQQNRSNRGYDTAVGYGGNPINHTELRDDRVVLIADAVRPGIYTYQYLLRATTSGTFLWPAAKISLMYEPEQFGTCAEGVVKVQ